MDYGENNWIVKKSKGKSQYNKPELTLLSALKTEGKQVTTMSEFTGPITMLMYGPS